LKEQETALKEQESALEKQETALGEAGTSPWRYRKVVEEAGGLLDGL